jgi:tRNA (guanine-N7-)-methyltransferase
MNILPDVTLAVARYSLPRRYLFTSPYLENSRKLIIIRWYILRILFRNAQTNMPRNKLKKYAEIEAFPNVTHNPDTLRGVWNKTFFRNDNPITLELGCGVGVLILELARRYPERNFIGIDNKRARVWTGARAALDEGLQNVAFITDRIEMIAEYFDPGEVSEIWIAFPDPYPKRSRQKRRLISPRLLNEYRKIIAPDCIFHLKTDDDVLFEYTCEILKDENAVIHQTSAHTQDDPSVPDDARIQTVFEKRHLEANKTIKYVRFALV